MFRAVLQNADLCRVIFYLVLTSGCGSANADGCHEVKTAYMMRQIGQVELVPENPQTDTFDSLVSFTSNLTSALLDSAYSSLASDCRPHVLQLFNDINGHLSGDPNSFLEKGVGSFFNDLFPLVYRQLLNPGIGHTTPKSFSSSSSTSYKDCLRMTRQDISPFGPHPQLLVSSLSHALGVGRTVSRLLRLAGDVVDATEKATLSRDCGRGLVRMQYCSHCRGLTLIRPCIGLCVNVMRGCLVGISELAAPWRNLVVFLQRLASTLATSSNHNSMELALLAVRNHVNDAILHAQLHGPRITAIVEKVCGPQVAHPRMVSGHPNSSHATTPTARLTQRIPKRVALTSFSMGSGAYSNVQLQSQRSFPLKGSRGDKSRSLKKLSREFEGSIQRYQLFFSELPEMLCESEMAVEQHTCWSGQDVVESYAGRVVGSTLKAQRENPEMTVRNMDPVLRAAKQRLEQITQELLLELGWARTAIRKDEEEDGGSAETDAGSGYDCDDEDGCEASGEVKGIDTDDLSSGHSPVMKGRVVLHPPHHRIPPHLNSPTLGLPLLVTFFHVKLSPTSSSLTSTALTSSLTKSINLLNLLTPRKNLNIFISTSSVSCCLFSATVLAFRGWRSLLLRRGPNRWVPITFWRSSVVFIQPWCSGLALHTHHSSRGCTRVRPTVYVCFVDLEMAFDHLHRGDLWRMLWECRVPDPLIWEFRLFFNECGLHCHH
ncbi:glypican-5-like isoform X2 [Syngnathoides biaculeatus]|uniref:glypican-5-like isoform X2 n=1 Tax=Syngnathoides biaculeatus TaxID=300417 RepID=UPI002ADE6BDC|nr:glypican-5-like isoform X2 [Syngnathoides biaculeatus]